MPAEPRRIVIIGATSAIAEHCARIWVQRGARDIVLVGRNQPRLDQIAMDLQVRNADLQVHTQTLDFTDPQAIGRGVDQLCAHALPDIVLIAHGHLADQSECQADASIAWSCLVVNGVSPVVFAEAFVKHMERANQGCLALIGSVAGDRGRRSNYVYGAAKGMVTRYAQGLQHRLAATQVRVLLIKPGPTDTPMTAAIKAAGGRLAPVDSVAQAIVNAVERGAEVIYAPRRWGLIMFIIMHLPRAIFHRLKI